jgi:hypothetical protein
MTTKKLIIFNLAGLILMMVLAWLVFQFNQEGFVQHLDGTYMAKSSKELYYSNVRSLLFSFPLLALIVGAVIAIFVQRELPYKNRFVRCFLWTLLVIYSLLALMSLVKLAMSN